MDKEILKAFLRSITGNDIMKTNNNDYGCVYRFIDSDKYKELKELNSKNKIIICGGDEPKRKLLEALESQNMADLELLIINKPKIQDIESIQPKLIEQPFLKPLTRQERRKNKSKK